MSTLDTVWLCLFCFHRSRDCQRTLSGWPTAIKGWLWLWHWYQLTKTDIWCSGTLLASDSSKQSELFPPGQEMAPGSQAAKTHAVPTLSEWLEQRLWVISVSWWWCGLGFNSAVAGFCGGGFPAGTCWTASASPRAAASCHKGGGTDPESRKNTAREFSAALQQSGWSVEGDDQPTAHQPTTQFGKSQRFMYCG